MTPEVVVERRINASQATVFSFFTDSARWLSWMGVEAELDPRPGGVFRMNVRGDDTAAGEFVIVEPHSRIVFTWGWEAEGSPVPPGSSTVDITFEADGAATNLRLRHRGLPVELFAAHGKGWNHYLDRLVIRGDGGDPGVDEGFTD
ncbi:SRPBCC domain-containing protein [Amycolatopsis sp. NPDC059657]|uniref:SRPBCC family protein n=1 Tax=Amycolatopsis sp. NPDC059657 TaxID=3346899 RepID=UPI00366D80B7